MIVGGRPVELDAHLARLHASARELFGDPAAARTHGPARALAQGEAHDLLRGRLRLTLATASDGTLDLAASAEALDPSVSFPPLEQGARLASIEVPRGLGRHKWADRRLIESAAAELDGAQPLIVDSDGTVLETERANVFAIREGVLLTPPADGRILPGIARGRILEIAHQLGITEREAQLSVPDLQSADEVFLTGSLRGLEPVTSIDGVERTDSRDNPVTARIAAVLRERWLAV